jgi:hypothetical protein
MSDEQLGMGSAAFSHLIEKAAPTAQLIAAPPPTPGGSVPTQHLPPAQPSAPAPAPSGPSKS